jgi:hypothetical protein
MSLNMHCSAGLVAALWIGQAALADEPPDARAPDREKLAYLFESWRGHSEESLKAVWGREETREDRGDTTTYLFERTKRGPAIGFGGVTVIGREVITCRAYFQIGLERIVTRATWRGASADACWSLFRESVPPAPLAAPDR